jgi:small-conductance mechanosensitive channel
MPFSVGRHLQRLGLGLAGALIGAGAAFAWHRIEGLRMALSDLGAISWMVGGEKVSLVQGAQAVAVFMVCFTFFLLLSPLLERLVRSRIQQRTLGITLARLLRILLLSWGALIALSSAGIGIGIFAALLSAVGVGAGLAVRRLASNYVSGLVLLLERAVRLGDMVRSGPTEGRVKDIGYRASTVLVRGSSVLVPNDVLANSIVENLTLSDADQMLTTELSVDHNTDLNTLRVALEEAMRRVPDVLSHPAPSLELTGFADGLLELTACYWVSRPAKGAAAVRSDVNLEMLSALRREGITLVPRRRMTVQF